MSDFPRKRHRKNPESESRIAAINERLSGIFETEDAVVERPVFLIIGHQRSGSTLVGQYLVSRFRVGYPSNVIARFWRAPLAGITLQEALLDADAGDYSSSFASELGTTFGLLEPHEFSYFWEHWFPEVSRCRDERAFCRVLGAMEETFAAPLLFKNNFNALRVPVLAELLPSAVFIRVRRDLLDVACSTLEARRLRFDDDRAWFGLRPEACAELENEPPFRQIALQILHTERAMSPAVEALPPARVIDIDYEAFCRQPEAIIEPMTARGAELRADVSVPSSFVARSAAAGHPDAAELRRALDDAFA